VDLRQGQVDMRGEIEAASRSHNQPAGVDGQPELSNISSDTGTDAAQRWHYPHHRATSLHPSRNDFN